MIPALISFGILLAGTLVGLQSWILLELVSLKVSIAQSTTQINRIVSDAESEKGTRKRIHEDFERRLRILETHHL